MKSHFVHKFLSNFIKLFSIISVLFNPFLCLQLKGVTISNWPYVESYVDNSGHRAYDGFAIELIDRISKSAGFDYELYITPDGKYGVYDPNTGRMDGMIAEVSNNIADFAIADLTVTEERRRFVDFTDPFMSSGIAAIVHKKYLNSIQTFGDLYYQTDVKYGVIEHSATHTYFRESNDPIIRKMYSFMTQHNDVFVRNKAEGSERANQTNYAFISESVSLEFIANVNCDLVVVNDTTLEFKDFQRHFAVALRKDSQYLNAFNFAINELNQTGHLEAMRAQYWVNECNIEDDFNINNSLKLSFVVYLYSVLVITTILF